MTTPIITKIDANTIKIVQDTTTTRENSYSYGDLIKQKEAIVVQKASEIEQRDKEIAEVDALIAECIKLGVGV